MPARHHISEILNEQSLRILGSISSAKAVVCSPESSLHDPKEVTTSQPISSADTKLISELIADVNSWNFCKKRCLPRSSATIALESPEGNAKLIISMNCAGWIWIGGKDSRGGFFDPIHDEIEGILKRTFPTIASPNRRCMWRRGVMAKLLESETPVEVSQNYPSI